MPGPVCPDGCGRPLSQARPHCEGARSTPCGWIHCACGADIRVRDGKYITRTPPGLYRG